MRSKCGYGDNLHLDVNTGGYVVTTSPRCEFTSDNLTSSRRSVKNYLHCFENQAYLLCALWCAGVAEQPVVKEYRGDDSLGVNHPAVAKRHRGEAISASSFVKMR
eukprot:4083061-Amphidinium_carterae.1